MCEVKKYDVETVVPRTPSEKQFQKRVFVFLILGFRGCVNIVERKVFSLIRIRIKSKFVRAIKLIALQSEFSHSILICGLLNN